MGKSLGEIIQKITNEYNNNTMEVEPSHICRHHTHKSYSKHNRKWLKNGTLTLDRIFRLDN